MGACNPTQNSKDLLVWNTARLPPPQSDAWRLQQLHKAAADPRHPWSRFNVGSLSTLTDRSLALIPTLALTLYLTPTLTLTLTLPTGLPRWCVRGCTQRRAAA